VNVNLAPIRKGLPNRQNSLIVEWFRLANHPTRTKPVTNCRQVVNCLMIEMDKASLSSKYDPLGPLYSLLEQRTAEKFADEALDMPANASHILYVATANSLATISEPILSRCIVLKIDTRARCSMVPSPIDLQWAIRLVWRYRAVSVKGLQRRY